MKKAFYLRLFMLFIMTAFFSKAEAQYHFVSITRLDTLPQNNCGDHVRFHVHTNIPYPTPGNFILNTRYGDGKTDIFRGITDTFTDVYISHYYDFPGHYEIRFDLIDSTASGLSALDSATEPITVSSYCNSFPLSIFYDLDGTCSYDSTTDIFNMQPLNIEVSQNGVPLDTVSCTSGFYYDAPGSPGDVYAFRIISIPSDLVITCPTGGIMYDTISFTPINYSVKSFGLNCIGTGFDLSVNAIVPISGVYDQLGYVYVTNNSCNTVNATVTLTYSPKYNGGANGIASYPSNSGNTLTWNLTGIARGNPTCLVYKANNGTTPLVAGDTVMESISVTPTSGDINLANNAVIIVDTIKAGCDPNEMLVSPSGNILAGTQLQYTIGFENTGNDTAFYVSVYDTLSDNVNIKSLRIVMASAVMNIATLNIEGHNIIRFDFPNINLLDSSHHGQSDGMVIFTINAKNGLPFGTTIFNHAGIFFDYNPVVMTDTVENIIGFPAVVATVSKADNIAIYPNPATDELSVKVDNCLYNTITITNTLGQQMMKQEFSTAQTKINVKTLPSGVYYISLRGDSGIKVQQFVKM
jgi:uncharacterized repeat protein (TIGR01451 family)